jgi:phage replication O-like protein O
MEAYLIRKDLESSQTSLSRFPVNRFFVMKELQIENGNYTRIVNKVLDELVKVGLLGSEYAICLFVIRKTYGFNKISDKISLTQFEKATNLSRPTIVKSLKKLVKTCLLVKLKDENGINRWKFNKYYTNWQVVNRGLLVNSNDPTSKVEGTLLVNTPLHTKDNTKDNTKGLQLLKEKLINRHLIK